MNSVAEAYTYDNFVLDYNILLISDNNGLQDYIESVVEDYHLYLTHYNSSEVDLNNLPSDDFDLIILSSHLRSNNSANIIDSFKEDTKHSDVPQLLFVEPATASFRPKQISTHADYLVSWPDEQQPFLDVLEALAL